MPVIRTALIALAVSVAAGGALAQTAPAKPAPAKPAPAKAVAPAKATSGKATPAKVAAPAKKPQTVASASPRQDQSYLFLTPSSIDRKFPSYVTSGTNSVDLPYTGTHVDSTGMRQLPR